MKLLIIRNGQSEADIMNVHRGRADFALTALGHRQTGAMARRVASEYDVRRIYTGTLRRARQTAAHLETPDGLTATEDADLMEFNNGLLAGLGREEAAAKYPNVERLPLRIFGNLRRNSGFAPNGRFRGYFRRVRMRRRQCSPMANSLGHIGGLE